MKEEAQVSGRAFSPFAAYLLGVRPRTRSGPAVSNHAIGSIMSLESKLSNWTAPSSDTEQEKQARTERMIREAINAHRPFDDASLNVFAKGSYANNTNVRTDSDVDVAVELLDLFYWEEATPGTHGNIDPYAGPWTPARLRAELEAALAARFGRIDASGSVAIQINSNTARVDADVVPCISYRFYFDGGGFREGTKIFPKTGAPIVNYPDQQLRNGRAKNLRTGNAFKKAVRIVKRLENEMSGANTFRELPSYFMECLTYNCPDHVFSASTWTEVLRAILVHVWDALQGSEEPADESARWLEVNECFYLFHPGQKWTRADGREFAKAAWNHVGFE